VVNEHQLVVVGTTLGLTPEGVDMGRKYGFSFSLKRALGISSARNKLARMTGIPTTRSGVERKIGRAVTTGGCCLPLVIALLFVALLIAMH